MTATSAAPPIRPAIHASAKAPPEFVPAELDELFVDRALSFPLFDADGQLLLEQGQPLSSRDKRAWKERGIAIVRLHPEDLGRLTFREEPTAGSDLLQLDSEVSRQLDEIIDDGLPDVKNEGPAVHDRMAVHGPTPYDPLHEDYLQKQQRASGEMLTAVLRDAVTGRELGSDTVTRLSTNLLRAMTDDADCVLSVAAESEHRTIAEHALRMAVLGMAIGVETGLDAENVRRIGIAGLVHDMGMTRVPEAIRQSSRRLTRAEFLEITKHPMYTLEILERMPGLSSQISIAAYQVHERPNGTGYPRGRSGDRIHPFARILHVADVYCALTAPRPYRRPLMPYAAMECLLSLARQRIVDAATVRLLLHVMSLFPIGSFVRLSDGSIGRVLRSNRASYWAPVVQRIQGADGCVVPPDAKEAIVDLSITDLHVTQALPTPGRGEVGLTSGIVVHHGC
jgi:HD-GYP domain-containing protein (c-di-GMP phosphodiesterase class II)